MTDLEIIDSQAETIARQAALISRLYGLLEQYVELDRQDRLPSGNTSTPQE